MSDQPDKRGECSCGTCYAGYSGWCAGKARYCGPVEQLNFCWVCGDRLLPFTDPEDATTEKVARIAEATEG